MRRFSSLAPRFLALRPISSQTTPRVGTSTALLAKWGGLLNSSNTGTPHGSDQLRQLLQDALHIYKNEPAAAVMPDGVTDLLINAYCQQHSKAQRLAFFLLLSRDFNVDSEMQTPNIPSFFEATRRISSAQSRFLHATFCAHVHAGSAVESAVQLWQDKAGSGAHLSPEVLYRLADRLSAAATPQYMQLLLPISQHSAGITFLVSLRSDLQQLLKQDGLGEQGVALRAVDRDLRTALARWFSGSLLQLERITWEGSSGQLLERVMATEAVHRMQHLEELRRRLQQADRRVFAFMHPSLPGEPLVVLHTAILDKIPHSMAAVFAQPAAVMQQQQSPAAGQSGGAVLTVQSESGQAAAGCSSSDASSTGGGSGSGCSSDGAAASSVACFYSISSGQAGLSGVDLGNFLIKRAVQRLLIEMPQLQHLVTLSPIPGFRAWLITKLQQQAADPAPNEATAAAAATAKWGGDSNNAQDPGFLAPAEAATVSRLWQLLHGGAAKQAQLASRSGSGGASDLLELVQQHSWLQLPEQQQLELQHVLQRLCAVYLLVEKRRRFALDPVAHFHLKNGAWLWRINCRADISSDGLDRSCGLMVNYKYVLADVASNNQLYLVEHGIAAADAVKQLLL